MDSTTGKTDRAPGRDHTTAALVLAHTLGIVGSTWLAYLLRFEFLIPAERFNLMLQNMGPVVLMKLVCLYAFGAYQIVWRYVGLSDLRRLVLATLSGSAFISLADLMFQPQVNIPRSVIVMDWFLTTAWVTGSYVLPRYLREVWRSRASNGGAREQPAVIVGAGDAGEMLLNEIRKSGPSGIRVVRFLDDQAEKIGRLIHGVGVDGPIGPAAARLRREGVACAIIAIPSASSQRRREIAETLLRLGYSIQTLPPVEMLASAPSLLARLRQIDIEDLLSREPVQWEKRALADRYSDRVVVVTGAAGSIGSELCRQLLELDPKCVIAVDRAETPLVELERSLRARFPESRVSFVLGDVTDAPAMRTLLLEHRPSHVFHAAAVKHVPVAQTNPMEAARVNVLGTRTMIDASIEAGVGRFLLISTDKAVRPANVMGATKRAAELLVQTRGGVAVRFGNVLGSSGSVINVFKDQIGRGGPVTVTHPEMRRFFMTITEAVHLLLHAATLGRGGEIFVLDMGQPVKILDVARDLIRLSGYQPDAEIQIVFSGIRPGEKLFEDLWLPEETVGATDHPKIMMAKAPPPARERVEGWMERLEGMVSRRAGAQSVVALLREFLPEFQEAPAGEGVLEEERKPAGAR